MTFLPTVRARLSTLPQLAVDSVIAAGVLALCSITVVLVDPNVAYAEESATPTTFLLLIVLTVPLALRRRYPVPVFLVIPTAMVAYEAIGYTTEADRPVSPQRRTGRVRAWRSPRSSTASGSSRRRGRRIGTTPAR